jgi:hypothetical protein
VFNQYFGNYLLNKGLLSAEQLYNALNLEQSVRTKLGVLAIDAGLMTAVQVEDVHQLQHTMDKKFGEIAISKGYLSVAQLEELLDSQKVKRLSLSQAIVDKGYLSLGQLETALENYKKENKLTTRQLDALHNADFDSIVRTFLDFSSAGANAELIYDYVALTLRNMVRFFGEEPVIDITGGQFNGWLASQQMTGNVTLHTGLAMNNDMLLEMAKRYSGENLTKLDDLATDSIAEFLNETNGIFTVNMSDRGTELNLEPQHIEKTTNMPYTGYRIPLRLADGAINLYINIEK